MKLFVTIIMLTSVAQASEAAHHTSTIKDLYFYFINFAIFVLFLSWKLFPAVKNFFREQHLLMKNHFHTSSEKLRLAKVEKEKIDKELSGLERKISDMKNASVRDLDVYRVRYKKELEDKLIVLNKDLEYQIEFDAMALNNNMYLNLLNKITDNVETNVQKNQSIKAVVTEALVKKSGLR